MNYAKEIKRLRLKVGFSQTELALRAGMTSQNLNQIEAGKREASTDLFFRIIEAMGYAGEIKVKKIKKVLVS